LQLYASVDEREHRLGRLSFTTQLGTGGHLHLAHVMRE
jgi:hypothetical protein